MLGELLLLLTDELIADAFWDTVTVTLDAAVTLLLCVAFDVAAKQLRP